MATHEEPNKKAKPSKLHQFLAHGQSSSGNTVIISPTNSTNANTTLSNPNTNSANTYCNYSNYLNNNSSNNGTINTTTTTATNNNNNTSNSNNNKINGVTRNSLHGLLPFDRMHQSSTTISSFSNLFDTNQLLSTFNPTSSQQQQSQQTTKKPSNNLVHSKSFNRQTPLGLITSANSPTTTTTATSATSAQNIKPLATTKSTSKDTFGFKPSSTSINFMPRKQSQQQQQQAIPQQQQQQQQQQLFSHSNSLQKYNEQQPPGTTTSANSPQLFYSTGTAATTTPSAAAAAPASSTALKKNLNLKLIDRPSLLSKEAFHFFNSNSTKGSPKAIATHPSMGIAGTATGNTTTPASSATTPSMITAASIPQQPALNPLLFSTSIGFNNNNNNIKLHLSSQVNQQRRSISPKELLQADRQQLIDEIQKLRLRNNEQSQKIEQLEAHNLTSTNRISELNSIIIANGITPSHQQSHISSTPAELTHQTSINNNNNSTNDSNGFRTNHNTTISGRKSIRPLPPPLQECHLTSFNQHSHASIASTATAATGSKKKSSVISPRFNHISMTKTSTSTNSLIASSSSELISQQQQQPTNLKINSSNTTTTTPASNANNQNTRNSYKHTSIHLSGCDILEQVQETDDASENTTSNLHKPKYSKHILSTVIPVATTITTTSTDLSRNNNSTNQLIKTHVLSAIRTNNDDNISERMTSELHKIYQRMKNILEATKSQNEQQRIKQEGSSNYYQQTTKQES